MPIARFISMGLNNLARLGDVTLTAVLHSRMLHARTLVPALPRGNAVCDAPRCPLARQSGHQKRTHCVRDGIPTADRYALPTIMNHQPYLTRSHGPRYALPTIMNHQPYLTRSHGPRGNALPDAPASYRRSVRVHSFPRSPLCITHKYEPPTLSHSFPRSPLCITHKYEPPTLSHSFPRSPWECSARRSCVVPP